MSEQKHIVCLKCGGKGCEVCHSGWECTMTEFGVCNKCDMGWEIGRNTNER